MNNQMKVPLYNALQIHNQKDPVSFHVPGHKYGQIFPTEANHYFGPLLNIDATELTGLDDLHSPEGAILEAEALLAELYQVKRSFFLVNGSTVGNLAMILAVCSENDTVLVQRNCHKSVIHALMLAKVNPVFLEPEYNETWKITSGISTETIMQAVQLHPHAKAIILTYPNYYGMVYDLKGIIEHAHLNDIPVLVDEAHGPHLIIGDPFPASAVQLGADMVVQSAHKTLPAMTMGSYLHFNSHLVEVDKVIEYLHILQSSSPSYPIMASLDLARNYLAGYTQEDLAYLKAEIGKFKERLSQIPAISVLEYPNQHGDFLKMTIQTRCTLNGFELQKRLEEEAIYTEVADPFNVLFIFPLMKEGQTYPLAETASKISHSLADLPIRESKAIHYVSSEKMSQLAVSYKEIEQLMETEVSIAMAEGAICAEAIIPYPPGIPFLLKGERITSTKLQQLQQLLAVGAKFQGNAFLHKGKLKVFLTTEKEL